MIHSSAIQWWHMSSLEITLEHGQLMLSGIFSGSKSYCADPEWRETYDLSAEAGTPAPEGGT